MTLLLISLPFHIWRCEKGGTKEDQDLILALHHLMLREKNADTWNSEEPMQGCQWLMLRLLEYVPTGELRRVQKSQTSFTEDAE